MTCRLFIEFLADSPGIREHLTRLQANVGPESTKTVSISLQTVILGCHCGWAVCLTLCRTRSPGDGQGRPRPRRRGATRAHAPPPRLHDSMRPVLSALTPVPQQARRVEGPMRLYHVHAGQLRVVQ